MARGTSHLSDRAKDVCRLLSYGSVEDAMNDGINYYIQDEKGAKVG